MVCHKISNIFFFFAAIDEKLYLKLKKKEADEILLLLLCEPPRLFRFLYFAMQKSGKLTQLGQINKKLKKKKLCIFVYTTHTVNVLFRPYPSPTSYFYPPPAVYFVVWCKFHHSTSTSSSYYIIYYHFWNMIRIHIDDYMVCVCVFYFYVPSPFADIFFLCMYTTGLHKYRQL